MTLYAPSVGGLLTVGGRGSHSPVGVASANWGKLDVFTRFVQRK